MNISLVGLKDTARWILAVLGQSTIIPPLPFSGGSSLICMSLLFIVA